MKVRRHPTISGTTNMLWHIINHRDYIDGPYDSYETALREARVLGKDNRATPRISQKGHDFYVYRPPYDREERWQPEYWICTEDAAVAAGVSREIFAQPLQETWR